MTEQPKYLTPEQVAEIFQLDPNYFRENARHWPHVRIARKIRFTPEQVEAIGDLHTVEPAEPVTNRNTFGRRASRRSA